LQAVLFCADRGRDAGPSALKSGSGWAALSFDISVAFRRARNHHAAAVSPIIVGRREGKKRGEEENLQGHVIEYVPGTGRPSEGS
jgi:hypothetical protein